MPTRLLAIGDSLTQGFQHAAIRRPEWSYPTMVARVLDAPFRQGDFAGDGVGGPLMDIELLAKELSRVAGDRIHWWDLPEVLWTVQRFMDRVETYWERGPGTQPSATGPIHHNLAVWGFEVLDTLTLSDAVCFRNMRPPTDNIIDQVPEFAMYRTARRVLNPSQDFALEELTQLGIAAAIGRDTGGIENLIVALGSNNALATCVKLALRWSQSADFRKVAHQRSATIWEPAHFADGFDRVAQQIQGIAPQRVFVATVPHVTIAPVSRGVSPWAKKRNVAERVGGYYEYYTHFWIWDDDFDPYAHPSIKREDARAVDEAIDAYNVHIREVAASNQWHVVELGRLLDELAYRRTGGAPKYEFPHGLVDALRRNPNTRFRVRPDGAVLLDTRFFWVAATLPADAAPTDEWRNAVRGGLFGLDGVHPTTIGYGIVAHEVLLAMAAAGVPGADPTRLDWDAIVVADTLVTSPPPILTSLQDTLSFLFGKLKLDRIIQQVTGFGSQATKET